MPEISPSSNRNTHLYFCTILSLHFLLIANCLIESTQSSTYGCAAKIDLSAIKESVPKQVLFEFLRVFDTADIAAQQNADANLLLHWKKTVNCTACRDGFRNLGVGFACSPHLKYNQKQETSSLDTTPNIHSTISLKLASKNSKLPISLLCASKRLPHNEKPKKNEFSHNFPDSIELPNLRGLKLSHFKGISEKRQTFLEEQERISDILDLLLHFPVKYTKWNVTSIQRLSHEIPSAGEDRGFVVVGTIVRKGLYRRNGKLISSLRIRDDSGYMLTANWYNKYYKVANVKVGQHVSMAGKVKIFGNNCVMENPICEVIRVDTIGNMQKSIGESDAVVQSSRNLTRLDSKVFDTEESRIFPTYKAIKRLSQKLITNCIQQLLSSATFVKESVPDRFIERRKLIHRNSAIRNLHIPSSTTEIINGSKRMFYDFMLWMQLSLLLRKAEIKKNIPGYTNNGGDSTLLDVFIKNLPFTLTASQSKALQEIMRDMASSSPMHRLLQGDVGSGKTVLAVAALIKAASSSNQGVFLSPTEGLAIQHYKTVKQWCEPLGIHVGILTSTTADKLPTLQRLKNGSLNICVGTHALLQASVEYNQLGLIVIDEQHRFGVSQRNLLQCKSQDIAGRTADMLLISATPIPRTQMMHIYGDLDISRLVDSPVDRERVITKVINTLNSSALSDMFLQLNNTLKEKKRIFWVCPLIKSNQQKQHLSAVTDEYKKLREYFHKDIQRLTRRNTLLANCMMFVQGIGILHGQMSSRDKANVMNSFRNGDLDILVTTSIIEVGIDIPTAAAIVISGANRFGLSQLHQLRGRVGRSMHRSFCYLLASKNDLKSQITQHRLKALETETSGFELSATDLHLRGEGTLFGKLQHGQCDITGIVPLKADMEDAIRQWAYEDAQEIMSLYLVNTSNSVTKPIIEESKVIMDGHRINWLLKS